MSNLTWHFFAHSRLGSSSGVPHYCHGIWLLEKALGHLQACRFHSSHGESWLSVCLGYKASTWGVNSRSTRNSHKKKSNICIAPSWIWYLGVLQQWSHIKSVPVCEFNAASWSCPVIESCSLDLGLVKTQFSLQIMRACTSSSKILVNGCLACGSCQANWSQGMFSLK